MEIQDYINLLKSNKNIVLTGAPGTGKTYLAKQIAAQMVLNREVQDLKQLTVEEQALLEEHTAFVQFHPSYDYTDFVEGLRPVQTDGEDVKFERMDGVFKEFCKRALKSNKDTHEGMAKDGDKSPKNIETAFRSLWEKVRNREILNLPLYKGKLSCSMIVDENNINTIYFSKKNDKEEKSIGNEVTLDKVNTAFYEKGIRSMETFNKIKSSDREAFGSQGNTCNMWAVMNYLLENINSGVTEYAPMQTQNWKKFVFIIDEINRGEISKIFGELFFSIDPGYRGNTDMRVRTQYQNLVTEIDKDGNRDPFFGEGFYVPENVYIIGTMNDIDRSIESMDFAIRRRFAWLEVKAYENMGMLASLDSEWQEKAKRAMSALNEEINEIEGLDSSYHIGASYFLKLSNYSERPFEMLWNYHLECLLKEYLRGTDNPKASLDKLKNCYDKAYQAQG